MTTIFSFDETDEHIPLTRRDTVSSINSFDDRWQSITQQSTDKPHDPDDHPRFRHFGTAWEHSIAEEDELPSRVGTPPIPIPNGNHSREHKGSIQVDFDGDFISPQVQVEGSLNRKMVPSDFEQVRVLGKGG